MSATTKQIWACEETALIGYLSARERIDTQAIETKNNASILDLLDASSDPEIMRIVDGVAMITIEGVLSKSGPDFIDRLFGFGGTSYSAIAEAVIEAATNDAVKSIRLEIDSPGGEVTGVDEVRTAIAEATKEKQVTAVNTGMTASAAYWLASAASEIVSTSPTNLTGSIGVVAVAIDRSDRDRRYGVVTVVSRNAPDKRPDLRTEAGRSVIQDQVDAIERVFTARIAEGRGVDVATVEKTFGRGRVLIAADPDGTKATAMSVRMIDKVIDGLRGDSAEPNGSVSEPAQVKEAAEQPATIKDQPPSAAGNEETMSEELKAKIAELETLLGSTTAAQGELNARMSAVAPILASDVYPGVVKEIAAKVLAGTEHPKALEGAIALYDAQHASDELGEAVQASSDAPVAEPKPTISGNPADGSIVSAESFESQVQSMREALGKE